jgi:IS66 C-terminal element
MQLLLWMLGTRHYEVPSDRGGERAAAIYSLIGTAKLNDLDPESYLRNVLSRIADYPINSSTISYHGTPPQNLLR